jgi:hypothetical protein
MDEMNNKAAALKTAYLNELKNTRAGESIPKRERDKLESVLNRHLPIFFRTDEGKSIVKSVRQVIDGMSCKLFTGKCGGLENISPEDLWVAAAAQDLKAALDFPAWKEHLIRHEKRLVKRALSIKTPDVDDADLCLIGTWLKRPAYFLPPLCFWSDQAAADFVTGLLNSPARGKQLRAHEQIYAETFRIWRRRWGLKKVPTKHIIIKIWRANARGELIIH